MNIPLGRPVASENRSPLTPALVALGTSRRCIAVRVSLPITVSVESTGASVVVPPGRGPMRTLITTGPPGVICTSVW